MATNNTSAAASNANPRSASAPRTSASTLAATTITTKAATNTTVSAPSSTSSPLHVRYPVNAVVELTLAPTGEQVQGTVYTTDEISQSVVLQKSLVHTTLANEIRILHAASILSSKIISHTNSLTTTDHDHHHHNNNTTNNSNHNNSHTTTTTTTLLSLDSLSSPLPTISRKTLEEREKRAMRLAEESLRHINQKASPEGQVTFDRLLKACNEVVWASGESIIVLGQIQVDPPYGPDQCQLLPEAVAAHHAGSQESLERVRKIVASVTSPSTTVSRSNSTSP